MLDGRWTKDDAGEIHNLKLGTIFTAVVMRRGGDSIYATRWIAVLNGLQVADTNDIDYAKGMVEWHIIRELSGLSDGYRALKERAPTSEALYQDGAWERWKDSRKAI